MKKLILIFPLMLYAIASFSQYNKYENLIAFNKENGSATENKLREFYYGIHSTYDRGVTRTSLMNSKTLEEVSPGYPTNWLGDYVSTEIITTVNGTAMKAAGTNSTLTSEQKTILEKVDLGSSITLNVKYRSKNSANSKTEIRTMSFSMTVVPEVEAEYRGGYDQMKKYLKENAINRISGLDFGNVVKAAIEFTVNESGEIINPHILFSTGDLSADRILLEAISKMPQWKPAQITKGIKVKQDFILRVSDEGC